MSTTKAASQKVKTSNGSNLKSTINETRQEEPVIFTPEEKKLLSHRLKTAPDEQQALLSDLPLISEKGMLWYSDGEGQGEHTEAITLSVYGFKSNRWGSDLNYLNNESFFVLSTFDGRLWRCKNFKEVAILQKAFKKDLKIRYPDLKWKF
jgi:hypothetical protein